LFNEKKGAVMRKINAIVIASLCALAVAATASAHTQTVAPPGQDEPVILNDPIARPWIQGHCHAQAPAVSGEASGGVASFSPAGALPCPPVPNPGGQVTGP
jgi:hypothetical protein